MIKRLLITLAGIAAFIFVPYFIGILFRINWFTDGRTIVWLIGLVIIACVVSAAMAIFYSGAAIISYIKKK